MLFWMLYITLALKMPHGFSILLRLLIIFMFTQSYSSMTSSGRVSKFRTQTNFVIKWNFPCGNEMFILSKLKIISSRFQSCHD